MLASMPSQPGSLYSRLRARMHCSLRVLGLSSLALGLLATGMLSLAVATDYWLYTGETVYVETFTTEGNHTTLFPFSFFIKIHSGLWRACLYHDLVPGEEPVATQCSNIAYIGQAWERVDGADTTNSINRAIRKSSPVIVASLLFQLTALGLSTVGSNKKNVKTLIGAVFFISSALILAIGVIFYISGVNDEVSHRKEPVNPEGQGFYYKYGWAFFFAGASFLLAMMAAVSNISLYLRRYPNLEDMVHIIPGLDKRGGFVDISSMSRAVEEEVEHGGGTTPYGAQNPTIIF